MNNISRREAIESMMLGGSVLTFSSLMTGEVEGQTPGQAPVVADSPAPASVIKAFAGKHQPKPLGFDPAKLNGLSEKLIRSHHENNYGGTIKALNTVELKLASLLTEKDLPPYMYGDIKREELIRTGSVVMHDLYFGNLGGDGKASSDILFAIRLTWGSYDQWEAEFKKVGNALAGGSGWVTLGYNFHTGVLHNYWGWDHMHNAPFSCPLLVMDMYEHSYHIDFGAAAAKYVDAFMLNVSWEEVNRRFVRAQKAAGELRA
ncbi:MAG TPA: Fe-Mn family superoxide dismutase [Blastocatellia bacterium]|nr:Fe-Mn family superoxide dismutase [Blastocatellia bacterium]